MRQDITVEGLGADQTAHFMARKQKKMRKGSGSHYTFQGCTPETPGSPTTSLLLKAPHLPNSTTLGTKSSTHGLLGGIQDLNYREAMLLLAPPWSEDNPTTSLHIRCARWLECPPTRALPRVFWQWQGWNPLVDLFCGISTVFSIMYINLCKDMTFTSCHI
jgi:hypothetical protein